MPSFISWLDYSEHERRKALDVIDLFREKETRDELGLGAIRDAFAERLFPGISTIQTRARYFLFVPWTFLELERRGWSRADARARARKEEVALIDALVRAGERDGVIGIEARAALKRLPSDIYWAGLGTLAIRRFEGSRDQLYGQMGFATRRRAVAAEAGETVQEDPRNHAPWDPHLPPRPKGFPENATLALTGPEASYLRDRIRQIERTSLLAHLVEEPPSEPVAFPWEHPSVARAPSSVRKDLIHARSFSEALQGPALLYNLMLSEKANHEDWVDLYRSEVARHAAVLADREAALRAWDRTEFWSLAGRVPRPTRDFVEDWLRIALPEGGGAASPDQLIASAPARTLVHGRERKLKGPQARFDNDTALRNWNGAAGAGQFDYRWRRAQAIVTDIVAGLGATDA